MPPPVPETTSEAATTTTMPPPVPETTSEAATTTAMPTMFPTPTPTFRFTTTTTEEVGCGNADDYNGYCGNVDGTHVSCDDCCSMWGVCGTSWRYCRFRNADYSSGSCPATEVQAS